jgi:predicted SnoaL-like aldol condensation-catalyzing enzyme
MLKVNKRSWGIPVVALALSCVNPAHAQQSDTEANRELVTEAFTALFIEGDVSAVQKYWAEDYIQHNPQVPDGRAALEAFAPMLAGSSTTIARIIADGDLVAVHHNFVQEPGTKGSAIVDIFRVEDGKIKEHWDVIQQVPESSANQNGMF